MPGPPIYVDDTILLNVTNLNGNYRNCILSGSLRPAPGAKVIFFDCLSGHPGLDSPIINLSGSGDSTVIFRSYSGGIKFISGSNPTFVSTIEFVAGRYNSDPSMTNGFISVRGVAAFNPSGSTATYETGSLINAASFENITVVAVPDPNLQTKVDELHKIHGLDDASPLTVNLTERVAGAITQSINYDSGSQETIVTRIP